eukprot:3627234-Amphidinium_carterae.1
MKLSMEKMQERLSRLMYTQEESDREMQLLRGESQDIRSSESQAWKVEQEVTVDTDPQSIGMDWWGTTYVKIDASSAAAPAAPANNAVVPSGD